MLANRVKIESGLTSQQETASVGEPHPGIGEERLELDKPWVDEQCARDRKLRLAAGESKRIFHRHDGRGDPVPPSGDLRQNVRAGKPAALPAEHDLVLAEL